MKSIFRLEEVKIFDNDRNAKRDAYTSILGHYSSLDKAVETMLRNNEETSASESVYAYFVKEIAVDAEIGYFRWLSVRSYSSQGVLLDECLQDYNLVNQYQGRDSQSIRFREGDIVEVLDYNWLFPAIVAALPPTPEDNHPYLDAMDDAYLVLSPDADPNYHTHVPPTQVFALNGPLPDGMTEALNKCLQRWREEGSVDSSRNVLESKESFKAYRDNEE